MGGLSLRNFGNASAAGDVFYNGGVPYDSAGRLLVDSGVLAQTAIPVILQSSGTIGNNGALSAITALPTTYASCYLYFPVDKIAAGVAAGLYYCVMSSTTAGTIYNNKYDPTLGLMPTIPASPTAFVTTGPGAYVQTTGADITLLGCKIPGGAMGNNGSLRLMNVWVHLNSAGTKTWKWALGGIINRSAAPSTTPSSVITPWKIQNMGVTNLQFWTSGNSLVPTTIDTSTDKTLTAIANLAVATDYIFISDALIEILYGA